MDYEKLMLKYLENDSKRIKHTYGVLKRSLELGKIYNADLEVLRISSLLHDITKLLTYDEHKELINNEKLFNSLEEYQYHAYSAYYLAKSLNITNSNILNSIKYHQWGKIEMSLENMILCISDYTEENRTHKDAEIVYKLALKNLEEAYLVMTKKTIDYLENKGIKIKSEDLKIYKYYEEKYGINKRSN